MNKVCGCNGCISFFGRDLGSKMLKSPEILTNERKYDRQGAKVCGIFSNFALGLLYLKNTVCHKIGKIAESYQSKTPKQEKRMMQSMLLVFFRKDKGECYTYLVWHFVRLFFRLETGASVPESDFTRYETAQVVFSLASPLLRRLALPDW